jgi:hypothetical protein
MFDLDDVCAPVGEDGSGRGDERELCDFEDPNALHHLDQVSPLLTPVAIIEIYYCNVYS